MLLHHAVYSIKLNGVMVNGLALHQFTGPVDTASTVPPLPHEQQLKEIPSPQAELSRPCRFAQLPTLLRYAADWRHLPSSTS